jgi:N-acetyl-anhydromuramyl-L-alanine amidase AmpD
MTQSPEYPDLQWSPPRAFGRGRDGKGVRYIVIHYTAGSERSTSAEDGAAYDRHRTDGTSTHYFVDCNSIVQCVKTTDRANAARTRG